jgi:hypothetical protein
MRPITRKLAITTAAAGLVANIASIALALSAGSPVPLPWTAHVMLTAIAGGFLLAAWSDARRRAGHADADTQDAQRTQPATLSQSLRQMGLLDHLKKSQTRR